MKRGIFLSIPTYFLITSLFVANTFGEYGGGGGWTPEDPFLISEPAHLLAIGSNPAHWNKYFKLTADIDMTGYSWTTANFIGINFGTGNFFSGTFDGDNHSIQNLSFSAASGNYVGIFGYIDSGTVKNLHVVNSTISVTTATNIGALAGAVVGSHLENCSVNYTLTTGDAAQFVGGLAGQAAMSILTNCSTHGTLTVGKGSKQVGGLVGNSSSNMIDCLTSGDIITVGSGGNACYSIGGLVGLHNGQAGPIDGCSSSMSITPGGAAYTIGGLVGKHTQGNISNCSATGSIHGSYNVGGLIGESIIAEGSYGTISNSYSTSEVVISSTMAVGGLIGYAERVAVTDCHSSGPISAPDSAQQIGGLVGSIWQNGTLTNCFSTSTVTGGVNAAWIGGLVGLTSSSTVSKCYSTGAVISGGGSNAMFIGGLIGTAGGPVLDSYSLSPVNGGTGSRYIGGLLGQASYNSVTRCYSAGQVLGGTYLGGLIADSTGATVSACFWDKETSGLLTSSGGKGMTTVQMQQESTFTSVMWDFVNTWKMYDYPGLAWQPEIGTSGTTSASVAHGEQGAIQFSVFCLRNATLNWTVQDYQTCSWITAAAPVSGTSTGPNDLTWVQLTLNPAALDPGTYTHELRIVSDQNEIIIVPISMRVFYRINLDSFALLASNWDITGCDFGQPCKAVDWYVDGAINVKDLEQLADAWLGEEVVKTRAEVIEGFETGDFSAVNWSHGGNAPWTIVTDAHQGTFAAKSGAIGNAQTSVLELTLNLTGWEVNTISFAWRTSCEDGYDFLRFYVDNVEKFSWSGVSSSYLYPYTVDITPGVRTFKWVYSKDASDSAGLDCAWIDTIHIYAR